MKGGKDLKSVVAAGTRATLGVKAWCSFKVVSGRTSLKIPGKILQVPIAKISEEDHAQDLLDRFSVEAAVQDFCVRLSVHGAKRRSPQKICVRALKVRSLFKLSKNDLRARPLLSSPGLRTRSL